MGRPLSGGCRTRHPVTMLWNGAYPPSEGYPTFTVTGCDGECGYE
jgi:hypothetical protein